MNALFWRMLVGKNGLDEVELAVELVLPLLPEAPRKWDAFGLLNIFQKRLKCKRNRYLELSSKTDRSITKQWQVLSILLDTSKSWIQYLLNGIGFFVFLKSQSKQKVEDLILDSFCKENLNNNEETRRESSLAIEKNYATIFLPQTILLQFCGSKLMAKLWSK